MRINTTDHGDRGRQSTPREAIHGQTMKQILLFGLLFVHIWTCKMSRCYDEHELREAAHRKLKSHYPQPLDPSPAAYVGSSCPVKLYQQQLPKHLSGRSLSPWRYILVTNKVHYPTTYSEAQCLCSGCIIIQDSSEENRGLPVENHDYNSVPIMQNRVFLKRELCSDGKKYHLKPVNVEVAIGCTCTRPKTTS